MFVQLDVLCTKCGRMYSEVEHLYIRRGESFVPYTFNRTRWSLQYTLAHTHLAVLVCRTDGVVVVVGYAGFDLGVNMAVVVAGLW